MAYITPEVLIASKGRNPATNIVEAIDQSIDTSGTIAEGARSIGFQNNEAAGGADLTITPYYQDVTTGAMTAAANIVITPENSVNLPSTNKPYLQFDFSGTTFQIIVIR